VRHLLPLFAEVSIFPNVDDVAAASFVLNCSSVGALFGHPKHLFCAAASRSGNATKGSHQAPGNEKDMAMGLLKPLARIFR
jgi:hypothetical protein